MSLRTPAWTSISDAQQYPGKPHKFPSRQERVVGAWHRSAWPYSMLTLPPGNVFEKRLIETYVAENGKDPVTGEGLTTEDLIELKSNRIVRPRPPTLTSIPSLLSVFQNEWDALALESYTLRQQLAQTRQELSTALYQHDAAVRVIGRLTKERDEARDALSKVTVRPGGGAPNGEQMEVDRKGLPEPIAAKVQETQERYAFTPSSPAASFFIGYGS